MRSLYWVSDAIMFTRVQAAPNGTVALVTRSPVVFQVGNPSPNQTLHVCRFDSADPTCYQGNIAIEPPVGNFNFYTVTSAQTSFFLPYRVPGDEGAWVRLGERPVVFRHSSLFKRFLVGKL